MSLRPGKLLRIPPSTAEFPEEAPFALPARIFTVSPNLRLIVTKADELYLLEFLASTGIWTARVEGDTIDGLYVKDNVLVVGTGRDLLFHLLALAVQAAQAAPAPSLPLVHAF